MSTFYEVDCKDIKSAEDRMQLSFPSELKNFYMSHGYGFLDSSQGNFNRIMDPASVADFRLQENEYENMESIEIYNSDMDKLIFFEVSEGLYLSIELTTKYKQKVFLMDKVLSNSLEEFFENYTKDENLIYSMVQE